ncbi:MAG: hypothetical protein H0U05_09935 [Actinobacteria bacterium]|nr:hypothetical protein [Actinomycetota bacterium]
MSALAQLCSLFGETGSASASGVAAERASVGGGDPSEFASRLEFNIAERHLEASPVPFAEGDQAAPHIGSFDHAEHANGSADHAGDLTDLERVFGADEETSKLLLVVVAIDSQILDQ